MAKVLAVFGATGQQGSSVVNFVLNDPELSQTYKIRAISRDINSEKIKQLREKVEVVQGDVLDPPSLEKALTGAHTVFAMTTPSFGPNALETEYNSVKTIADAAVSKGISYLIFSTLPSVTAISGGRYMGVTPFEAKAKAEHYIRSLPIKSAFYAAGFFMENFQSQPFLLPRKDPDEKDETWVMSLPNPPTTRVPFIDAIDDLGKFVGAILASPNTYVDKTICAAVRQYSWEEVAAIMATATGKKVVYREMPLAEFEKLFPPALAEIFADAYAAQVEFGYFGKESDELIQWAVVQARGKLVTLEEYWRANPLVLE